MSSYQRPAGREDFSVALVCALSLEFDAVCMVVDEFWDEDGDQFGKSDGDHNMQGKGELSNRRHKPSRNSGHSLLARQQGSNYGGTIKTLHQVNQGNRMRVSTTQPPRAYEQGGSSFMSNVVSGAGVQQGNFMEFY
ncbi:uncharacterized protein FPRO_12114 [Fusarium proliferatum ET1]|uniref:Uncharacterized protein n=1 Tax=Fusarium proliferatum (strain ET1) TaxID=1227346 RepID=A0A1L7W1Y6_FUSPR|nr:uncharacterized protein FPRO_12114 [Fusarium proliferatum ET1]CZR46664.1 uncharacterized protein FPRO_12114 [Fusarium proliferatum ET1]